MARVRGVSWHTIRQIGKFLNARGQQKVVCGFDSFRGLPEKWRDERSDYVVGGHRVTNLHKGAFSTGGLPPYPENEYVKWVPGWFNESLPTFLRTRQKSEYVGMLHVDCDIYSSSATVFTELGKKHRLRRGSVIIFDEFFNYREYTEHESRAFWEFLHRYPDSLAVEVLGTSTSRIELHPLNDGLPQSGAVRLI